MNLNFATSKNIEIVLILAGHKVSGWPSKQYVISVISAQFTLITQKI
jgi:hypothetical protein